MLPYSWCRSPDSSGRWHERLFVAVGVVGMGSDDEPQPKGGTNDEHHRDAIDPDLKSIKTPL